MGQERWSSLTVQLVKVMLEEILVPDSIEMRGRCHAVLLVMNGRMFTRVGASGQFEHYGLEDPNSLVGTHHGLGGFVDVFSHGKVARY